jgi:transposase
MRGPDTFTESLFSIKKLDDFVPTSHPLRDIRVMVNQALDKLEDLFASMYENPIKGGRPSIAPEKLLRAMVLQVLYSVRSERQLMEQVQYNLLFRWFIGLSMDDSVWVPTVFSKNRDRLIEHDTVVAFFNEVLAQAERKQWLSKEHFSVDGTLIQAWASHKSFVPKDEGGGGGSGGEAATADGQATGEAASQAHPDARPTRPNADTTVAAPAQTHHSHDFRGQSRSNATHASKTDPDSRLYRKGQTGSQLRFMGHTLMENRNGLIVNAIATRADGHAERVAAKAMIHDARQAHPQAAITLGADKGYDAAEFIADLHKMKVTPHVAQNKSGRRSAVPDEIAQTDGYGMSMQRRKRIEQGFGWAKTIGQIRQVLVRGLKRVDQVFVLNMAAYNLTRMRTLAQSRPRTVQAA